MAGNGKTRHGLPGGLFSRSEPPPSQHDVGVALRHVDRVPIRAVVGLSAGDVVGPRPTSQVRQGPRRHPVKAEGPGCRQLPRLVKESAHGGPVNDIVSFNDDDGHRRWDFSAALDRVSHGVVE